MKSIISFFFAVTISLPLWAEEQAQLSLNTLSQSIKSLNFSSSFVVVKNNQAEPYHWFHGISEQGEQLEIWSLLNGPRRDTLRKGDVVSYIEPEIPPYSIVSTDLKGPIPSVFYKDFSVLNNSYDFISVGRSRVLGRTAQLVRIVSKDAHRYGHWVWLDQESGLLLKLAIASRSGQLLEQIQFTHLDISEKPAESLVQLQSTELPKALEVPENYQQPSVAWTVNWLPSGFERLSTNRHRITVTKQPVEFMLFSDGLVDISVYVSPSNVRQRNVDFVMDGATVALNQVTNGFEVSVVGKIPSKTAKAIADSVALTVNKPK